MKAIFQRYTPRTGVELKVDPSTPEMKEKLPSVPEAPPTRNVYNVVKGKFAVLLDAVRNHIPAVDFLDAAVHLASLVAVFQNRTHTPEYY